MNSIKENAPQGATHYINLLGEIKYLQRTDKPKFMTYVVQFIFRIKPL